MREVFCTSAFVQPSTCFVSGPGLLGQIDAGVQQRFGIGLHPRTIVAVRLGGHAAGAQFVAGRVGLKVPPSRRFPVWLSLRSQSTIAADPEPIVSDAKASFTSCFVSFGDDEQRVDRPFDEIATHFGSHDQSRPNVSQLDHVGQQHHAVEEPQAGIADVEHERRTRQTQRVMHAHWRSPVRADRGTPNRARDSRCAGDRASRRPAPARRSRR